MSNIFIVKHFIFISLSLPKLLDISFDESQLSLLVFCCKMSSILISYQETVTVKSCSTFSLFYYKDLLYNISY